MVGEELGQVLVRVGLDLAQMEAGLATARSQLEGLAGTSAAAAGKSAAAWSVAATRIGASLTSWGSKMSRWGKSLTHHVTLPILGVGVVAGKMALDYEEAFTRISAISNTSAATIEKWREQVKELAITTARDPNELAEALYYLASAGLKTADVFPALEMSAKAAATGLGETTDVAKITAQVLNAYAKSGMTAARATDYLVAAVKAGTADPDEFAGALGRVLPIASRAKVGFEEVTASLAALSNIGLDVNEGVTALRGLLQAIVAPTSDARQAMKKLHIDADDLRRTLSREGLVGAMEMLDDAANGNIDVLRDLIPNIRSLTGQLGLTGENAKTVAAIFRQVKNASGAMNDAFAETAASTSFKVKQSWAEMKTALIELGDAMMPVIKEVANAVAGLGRWFKSLSPGIKSTVVQVGLLVAALGPLLRLMGGIVKLSGRFVGAIGAMGAASATAAGGGAAGGAAAGGAAGGGAAAAAKAPGLVALVATLFTLGAASKAAANYAGLLERNLGPLGEKSGLTSQELYDVAAAIGHAEHEAGLASETWASWWEWTGLVKTQMTLLNEELERMKGIRIEQVIKPMLREIKQVVPGQQVVDIGISFDTGKFTNVNTQLERWMVNVFEAANLTDAEKVSIMRLTTAIAAYGGALTKNEQELLDYYKAHGLVGDAIDLLKGKLDETRAAWRRSVSHVYKNVDGMKEWVKVAQDVSGGSKVQALRLLELIRIWKQSGHALSKQEQAMLDAAVKARDYNDIVRILEGALGDVKGKWAAQVVVTGLYDSDIAKAWSLSAALRSLPTTVKTTIMLDYVRNLYTSRGGIVQGATGFVTTRPTVLVGEGSYPTFAGRGAEAVLPLNGRGLNILAEALKRALRAAGESGGSGVTVVFNGPTYGMDDFERKVDLALRRAYMRKSRV